MWTGFLATSSFLWTAEILSNSFESSWLIYLATLVATGPFDSWSAGAAADFFSSVTGLAGASGFFWGASGTFFV